MSIFLQEYASEKSTYLIDNIQFLDENNDPITPNTGTVTWCLTDDDGTVINGRTNVSITSEISMQIVLEGDDLEFQETEKKEFDLVGGSRVYFVQRRVRVSGEVNSNIGNDLPVTQEFIFKLKNIECIT